MVDFANHEDVKAWLDAIEPELRHREVAVVIAARAALRVTPLLGDEFRGDQLGLLAHSNIILPSLRGAALPWAAARFPDQAKKLRLSAALALLHLPTDDIRRAPYYFALLTLNDSSTAFSAGLALARAAEYAARRVSLLLAVDANFATEFDAKWIDAGRSAAELAGAPLWLERTPQWALDAWRDLKSGLLVSHEDWRVWTDWYDARLAGKPAKQDLEIARVLIADEIWDQGPRAVNAEIARLIDLHTPKPPLIDVVPEQNRTGTRFGVDATGRIDMMRTPPTADDLQRLHYEEMRYKAMDLVALGQMLGDLAPAASRMLGAVPERIEDASVDRIWHRANTLRQRFDAHVRAPDGKLGPHPSRLDSLVAAHLGDFIGSYNIFIIGDPRGLELDRMQLGPQDREAAHRLVLLAAPIARATNETDAPTTPAARETLNEQVDSAIGAAENIHGDQAKEFAEKTTRNFVSELLRRAYEVVRKVGGGIKREAGFANKEFRGGAYKAAGATTFAGAATATVFYWPQLVSFVARHADELKEFVTAAFHDPALVEIIDWIAKASGQLG